ncbi:Benzoate 4-monooxygenase [Rhizoctonia solani AG-1 IB]|uniref:Benzoate 4-monooxygenase n=1 Tax=Thanatephorus cucumeris (strain AG1-IB / isolate 7/3/14) TaxID=1108050 RepID=M5CDI6_THACB|nr:Benzoate 4-monooxygenase [Rhizoctonia solani AG-1 IB]
MRLLIKSHVEISYLAVDVIGDLALGSSFGLIQAQKDSSLSIESVDSSGEPQRGVIEIPIVKTIARGSISALGIAVFPVWAHKFLRYLPWNLVGLFDTLKFIDLATTSLHARIKRGPKEIFEDGKRSVDIMDKLLEYEDEGEPLSMDELTAEAMILLIGGSDTTSNTLGCLFYYLAICPEIRKKLQAELDQHVPCKVSEELKNKEVLEVSLSDTVVHYEDVKNLPYLNACLKEALRIQSPVATGLPRVVPPGKTITISGQTFTEGCVISVPLYTINHSGIWGNDAAEFRPERWLEDESGSLNKYFQPFSLGPRACIGRNLAHMDLILIAATLARRYEIEATPTTKLVTYEGLLRSTVNCEVMIKHPTSMGKMATNEGSSQIGQYSVALGALALAYYLFPYLLDPYDYRRRFSGPPLAGLTNWWMSSVIQTGHHSEIVQRLHEKYGTFVRLGPNHISVADPDALEIVYGHGLLKSEFYSTFQMGPKTDLFNTRDKTEHSKKRKRVANIFSAQNSLAFEPRIRSHIRQLCAQWDMRCKEAARGSSGTNWVAKNGRAVIDVCAQVSYLAFDIIGDLALGSPFGLIQAQKDSSLSIESVDASGDPQRGSLEIPVIETIARGGIPIMAVGVFPSWAHKILILVKTSVEARVKRGPREIIEDGRRSVDLIDKLLEVQDDDGNPLSMNELNAEASVLLVAGSDTTSNTLGCLFYYLAIHPEIQQQLQTELDQNVPYDTSDEPDSKEGLAIPPYNVVVQYDSVKALPYLDACIKEALRLQSTVGTGLPRVVPPGNTVTVAGQTFKAGSVISVPSYTTNRSSVWGDDPEEFRPERWLDDNSSSLNKYFVPFSLGPRACIGRNIAYMELMLIAATLVRRYDVAALPTTKLDTSEGLIRSAMHSDVAIKRRKV